MRLCREFYFDSAHYLPDYRGKCENLHGHTYKLEVVVEDEVKGDGMILDFGKIRGIVESGVIEELDHKQLNEIMDNPTAENIVEWIWARLKSKLPLYSVRLWEGDGKWVEKTLR